MLGYIKHLVSISNSFKNKVLINCLVRVNFRNKLKVMASENLNLKIKSELDSDQPAKKIKLEPKLESEVGQSVLTRTVATMCGAWRRDEEYGGLVFVFKTRDGGLSPDPVKEEDFPENVEDFWAAPLLVSDDKQVCNFIINKYNYSGI